jgi:hypothetical protein
LTSIPAAHNQFALRVHPVKYLSIKKSEYTQHYVYLISCEDWLLHNLGENVFTREASDEFSILKDENVTIVLDFSGGEANRVILVNCLE